MGDMAEPQATAQPDSLVFRHGNKPMTDSVRVALKFEKRHDNVLRRLDAITADPHLADFCALNFEYTQRDVLGRHGSVVRQERVVLMTEAGYLFLVRGFTGQKAARMWLAFIAAFQQMRDLVAGIRKEVSFEQRRDLWSRLLDAERREQESRRLATVGAHILLRRKAEKPELAGEIKSVVNDLQPALPGMPSATATSKAALRRVA